MKDLTLRERYVRDMKLKNFADKTQEAYLHHITLYSQHFWKCPTALGVEEIKTYLYVLVEEEKSKSTINQVYSALRFLYETTLKQDWIAFKIPRSKVGKRLPLPFDNDELQKFFDVLPNLKYKAIFELMYCGGLRISEVINLNFSNINRKNMTLQVVQGKGKKDRFTVLSQTALETLEAYYRLYRPEKFLFPGTNPSTTVAARTVQHAFSKFLSEANIHKALTVHSLRHTFATDMLESGVDIYALQKLLGHSNIKTTSVYIHISHAKILRIHSPHDVLYKNKNSLKSHLAKPEKEEKHDKSK